MNTMFHLFAIVLGTVAVVGLSTPRLRKWVGQMGGFLLLPAIALAGYELWAAAMAAAPFMAAKAAPVFGTNSFVLKPVASIIRMLVDSFFRLMINVISLFILFRNKKRIMAFIQRNANPLRGGYNRWHLLAGAFCVSWVVNHPWLNARASDAVLTNPLMRISFALGIAALIITIIKRWAFGDWELLSYLRQMKKAHLREFGTLPEGRSIETEDDRVLLREVRSELDAKIQVESGVPESYRDASATHAKNPPARIAGLMTIRSRIAEQLGEADITAQAEAETDAEGATPSKKHLHQ